MKAALFLLLTLMLATLSARGAEKIRISSFSTILTEIAEQVGGDRVEVTGHVKPGVDPHEYEPKPADLKIVNDAQLLLLSAKHVEGYVGKLKQSIGVKARLVEVGNGFALLSMKAENGSGAAVDDPHWWHSMECVKKATEIVRDELIKLRPENRPAFSENGGNYLSKLNALEKWVKSAVAKLPRDQRKLVTSHDAFQYFARENGFTIYAIEGVSSADQPSSQKVASIIARIKAEHVKAIFPESIENPKVLQEITRETGAKLGGELYADGLGEGDGATFDGMMRHNVSTIVNALK